MHAGTDERTTPPPVSAVTLLSVQDVAGWLRVPVSTVYKLVRYGDLPGRKIGKHWRFQQQEVHAWLSSRRDDAKAP